MEDKICPLCGKLFKPKNGRQRYCNSEVIRSCIVCNRMYTTHCNPDSLATCDDKYCKKRGGAFGAKIKTKICLTCGRTFTPHSSRQKYCNLPITAICANCGKTFNKTCNSNDLTSCCSDECQREYTHKQQIKSWSSKLRRCELCGKAFTPVNNTQKICSDTHYLNCTVCGNLYIVDTSKNKADWPTTCSDRCKRELISIHNGFKNNPDAHEKFKQTCLKEFGVEHPMKSPKIHMKPLQTYAEQTGYSSPYANPEVRSKIAKKMKMSYSSVEKRIAQLLDQYKIKYEQHYMISNEQTSHEFDFYLPEIKMLIDGDGLFFHSYLDDPNGKQVLDYYDEDRLALVPEGHHIHIIPEGQEEREIKKLVEYLDKHIDLDEYDTEIFRWCRSISFPYPEYDEKRMLKDYDSLKKYTCEKYVPQARLGDSIIQNYHKSIYSAHVKQYVSPVEGWYNDDMLKQVIRNRLIYMNDLNPSKVLKGFNISKICPKVSVFNPVLAKYLTEKYLNKYDVVFDPFSGFSGRLLGVTAAGKRYIGQDLNIQAVEEANQIIQLLHLNGQVTTKDTLDCCKTVEAIDCILTCPPYSDKELYGQESVFKTCDEWIDLIITHYKAMKYVFVVDKTDKFRDFVVEEIKSTSHLNKVKELVIVI